MFLNDRTKSRELIYYEVLARRAGLTREEQWRFRNLQRGFAGEAEYDALFDDAGHGRLLIYRDLWLQVEKSVLQVDSLIVAEDTLIVNEIKNYSENHLYEGGRWFRNNRQSSEDPLAQASRTAGKLLKLNYHLPHRVNVEKKVVFVNPDFNLHMNSDGNEQFIVTRSGLRSYFGELRRLYAGRAARENAAALRQFIIDDPMPLPLTDISRLRTGNYCYGCGSYAHIKYGKFKAECHFCGSSETLEKMFTRAIIDFAILFYDESITTSKIYNFIGKTLNERTVRRLLNKYCHKVGTNRNAAYIPKSLDLEKLLEVSNYRSRYDKQKD